MRRSLQIINLTIVTCFFWLYAMPLGFAGSPTKASACHQLMTIDKLTFCLPDYITKMNSSPLIPKNILIFHAAAIGAVPSSQLDVTPAPETQTLPLNPSRVLARPMNRETQTFAVAPIQAARVCACGVLIRIAIGRVGICLVTSVLVPSPDLTLA
jgi:hypothetical protein